jgi:filamentous hemagglutinin
MTGVQAQSEITAAFGSAAAKQVGDYATQKYKEAMANKDPVEAVKWDEGGEYRVALHAGLGLLAGGVQGAVGATASAALMPEIGKAITDMDVPEPVKQALGAVAAATIGAAVGDVSGAVAGVNIDLNNRQLHPTETQRIKELAAGDPQQEARLTAAACALVHCADGVPKDDANYALLKALQTTGDTMTAEKTLLLQQTAWEGRTSGPLFQYTGVDQYLIDPATQNKVGTRLVGAVQAGAGIVGVATSGALCTTGIGCLAAGVTGTVSADYALAGTVQAVTGQATTPLGEQVLQSLGLSPGAAALTYAALGIVPVVGETLPVNKAVTAVIGAKEAVGADGVANTVSGARLTMQLSAEQAAGTRTPTAITSYSEHAAAQIAGRDGGIGVSPAAVNDAFANPVSIQYVPSKYGPTFKYTGQNATVVVNAQGNVVTAWGTSSAGVAK